MEQFPLKEIQKLVEQLTHWTVEEIATSEWVGKTETHLS